MAEKHDAMVIKILDTEYRIACPPAERDALKKAAAYVDLQMQQVRQAGRISGLEKIAVMTSLNMAHDLLSSQKDFLSGKLGDRLQILQNKLEDAIR